MSIPLPYEAIDSLLEGIVETRIGFEGLPCQGQSVGFLQLSLDIQSIIMKCRPAWHDFAQLIVPDNQDLAILREHSSRYTRELSIKPIFPESCNYISPWNIDRLPGASSLVWVRVGVPTPRRHPLNIPQKRKQCFAPRLSKRVHVAKEFAPKESAPKESAPIPLGVNN